jgi:polysaccharide export outer membrane protein
MNPATGKREQLAVPLKAILQRKTPDVSLQPDDILYIPDDLRKRRSADIGKVLLGTGQNATGALIYLAR